MNTISNGIIFLLLLIESIFIAVLYVKMSRINNNKKENMMTDFETGIGNLQYFKHNFINSISDNERDKYYLAYIILDSSYLRSYHSEHSFDEVMKNTAAVLSEQTGEKEICARITESGFAWAFKSDNDEDAKNRVNSVLRKLNSFVKTKTNNKIVFHGAYYHLAEDDNNCELLFFNLRKNCYKIFGSEKLSIYCDTYAMNTIYEKKKVTDRILQGFENREFKMYLQFIVDNKTKNIISAEALSRWDCGSEGIAGPGKYIREMESAGLISRHDYYMFENACRQLEKWNDTQHDGISISCNFTRITLSEEDFIDNISEISSRYNFDKGKLAIEITEDVIEKDMETAKKNVMRCKEMGFKIYLDDLGNGYTSLSNLCDYPIDVVKIDRDILLKTDNMRGKDLFSGIVALAHNMNIFVICEGVETEEQNNFVTMSDCDCIQGWYYAKALPVEELEKFIEQYAFSRTV